MRTVLEFPDSAGVIRGVAAELPKGGLPVIALREAPDVSRAVAGFDLVSLRVADRDSLAAWADHLDACGVKHSPLIEASLGWLLVLHDPDGIEIHLYTDAEHGLDRSQLPGHGRRIDMSQTTST